MTSEYSSKNVLILFFALFLPILIKAQTTVTLTSGSSWTVPSCVSSILVECWGGGGGGGYASNNGQTTGGGGGGAYAQATLTVTPGSSINYSIGAGGLGTSGTSNGGDTWFSSNTTVLAKGGNGAVDNSTTGATGGQASASIGTITFSGGNGGNGSGSGNCEASGGGGGGAGSTSNGNNGGNGTANSGVCLGGGNGGAGGAANGSGGAGGAGASSGGAGNNAPTANFGGGGGGAKSANVTGGSNNGGNGAPGGIKITYSTATAASSISYSSTSYCSSNTTAQTPTITGVTGGTFSATPSGLSINTTTGAITPSSSTIGNYVVTYSFSNSCGSGTATANVSITSGTTATISGPTNFCAGDDIVLTASSGATYLWNEGYQTASITVSHSGTYSVTVTDAGGCSASASATVIETQLPVAVITSNTGSFCDTALTTLVGSGGISYLWSTGSTYDTTLVSGNGMYSLTVTDANGCSGSVSINVQSASLLGDIALPDTVSNCEGAGPIILYANTPFADNYQWSNGGTSATTTVDASGTYSVTVSNACETKSKICVVEIVHCSHFKLPSAFTPNGDGINDTYHWESDGWLVSDFKMHIYNRWGQKLFETNNPNEGWDGTYNGEAQPTDSYSVFVEISYPIEQGKTRTDAKQSSFTLLR